MRATANYRKSETLPLFSDVYADQLDYKHYLKLLQRLTSTLFPYRKRCDIEFLFNSMEQALFALTVVEKHVKLRNDNIDHVIRLVPNEKYQMMNNPLAYYISKMSIRGQTKNELIWLTEYMSELGCGLVGDVIKMVPSEVIFYACAVPAIRNPVTLVDQLRRVLEKLELCFGMAAPNWVRNPEPNISELIAERDAKTERQERNNICRRHNYLRLVPR